jgi:hypothetical protein
MRRKHKKFIDPRYFMNEKVKSKEEFQEAQLPAWERPGYEPAEGDEEEAEDRAQTEAAKQVLGHLQQIKSVLNSPGAQHFGADSETRSKMEDLADIRDHFEDLVHYLEKY